MAQPPQQSPLKLPAVDEDHVLEYKKQLEEAIAAGKSVYPVEKSPQFCSPKPQQHSTNTMANGNMQSEMIEVFLEWKDGAGDLFELPAIARIQHVRDAFVKRRLLQDTVDPSQVQVCDSHGKEFKYFQKIRELGQVGQNPELPFIIQIPGHSLRQRENATTLEEIKTKLDGMVELANEYFPMMSSETTGGWPVRYHSKGVPSRLPEDYEFPREGLYELWLKWNIGNYKQKIPPLRILKSQDYTFLDDKPKPDALKVGATGSFKNSRRSSTKMYTDIKFVCEYIEKKARAEGMDTDDRTIMNVRRMYEQVTLLLFPDGMPKMRNGRELKWRTIEKKLQEKKRAELQEKLAAANK